MAHILVIDSDTATRTLVEQTLRPAGHVVLSATTLKQGVVLYGANPVDVAIICLYTPDGAAMNGIVDFLYESPGIEIMAFARKPGTTELSSFAHWLGATKSLTKPVDRRELLRAIDDVLRARGEAEDHHAIASRGATGRAAIARPRGFNPPSGHGSNSLN